MKNRLSYSSNKKVDYFDILSEIDSKPKVYKKSNSIFTKKTDKKTKKIVNIVERETEANRLRKIEIQAAKIEIYYLRTNGKTKTEQTINSQMQIRRQEIIDCKRLLSSEGYR